MLVQNEKKKRKILKKKIKQEWIYMKKKELKQKITCYLNKVVRIKRK